MSAIKMLRQKRADLVMEGSIFFDRIAAENRGLTKEEGENADSIDLKIAEIDKDILRAEKQMDRQRALEVVQGSVETGAVVAGAPGKEDTKKFSSLGEQLLAVVKAGMPNSNASTWDPRLTAGPTGLNEGIGAEGGFLVQTDFAGELLQNVWSGGEIASRVRRIGIGANSNGIRMYGPDETSRVNGSRWGGIQAYWTGEAGLKLASQPKWRNLKMELDKLTGLCYATDELLQDSTALESWLRQAFQDEFTFKIEDAIINGTGAGQPLGLLNSGAVITLAKESSQPNTTIQAPNVYKMWSRLAPSSYNNAVWLVNPDTLPQMWSLYTAVRNVAGTENVGGLALPMGIATMPGQNGSQYGTLMGRPVIPCEYCATLGGVGDIILVDLQQYLAIDKGPIQSASSIHLRFQYDETCFRFVYRFNGMPLQYSALTPYKGSTTTSPYVVLAAR